MTIEQRAEDSTDQFPVGMRVLAVDDDPICLLLLKNLLRKCKYHVTAVSHAIMALKLLRENKDNFDLVISDVHMPDMDGFKLLELVGLEMDLPVIMLSANSDPKLVMKGISHGACDYLLKPVRIEELQIIWQHVIRRKKFDPRDHNNSDKPQAESDEGGKVPTGIGKPDQNGKLNKKRKDQNEDDDEEHDDDGLDNDDPSMQKKPRVVWSVELHRKFVAAVNQLGLDKAVPKRILELMNVEKLTRENVASHLQKYRLYLKRISCVASQQANMVAAFGNTDSSYFRGSMNGIANFSTFSGTAQFQNAAMRSFPYNGMLGRLNSPAGLGVRGLPSSGVVPLGRTTIPGFPGNNDQVKFQPGLLPGKQNGSILQGMPTSFEFDELKDNKGVTSIREFSSKFDDLAVFPVSCGFPDAKAGNSSTTLPAVHNNSLILQGHPAMRNGGVGSLSSVAMASLSLDVPTYLQDPVRSNDKWPNSIQSSGIQPTPFSASDSYGQAVSYSCSSRGSVSTLVQQTSSQLDDVSPVNLLPIHLQDSVTDLAIVTASNGAQNMSCARELAWDDPGTDDLTNVSNLICNPVSSSVASHGVASQFQPFDLSKANPRNMDYGWIQQSNCTDSLIMQHSGVPKRATDMRSMPSQGHLSGPAKSMHIQGYNNFGSLEDLVSSMMKQEQDDLKNFSGDSFSL